MNIQQVIKHKKEQSQCLSVRFQLVKTTACLVQMRPVDYLTSARVVADSY